MTGNEQRASERYPADTVVHFYSLLAGEPVACKAQVQDVSKDGMGLYVPSFGWFSPGDALVIVLPGEDPVGCWWHRSSTSTGRRMAGCWVACSGSVSPSRSWSG
jgi:hypothetical protein